MARAIRIEYGVAFYHVMARGNGREHIFHVKKQMGRVAFLVKNYLLIVKLNSESLEG